MDTQQGTLAWFSARKGKLTASNFGAAAGVNPYCTRAKALRQSLGLDKFTGSIPACVWGTKNEKNAIKDYMIRTGNVVHCKGLYTHPDYPWLGGSPDGLVGDEGIIEVKCPFNVQKPHLKIPAHYYCQINGLLEIMNKQWCDFISWTPTEMKIYRVYRDTELWEFLLERYTVFYACMQRGCPDIPNMRSEDKETAFARIEASDAQSDYSFWSHVEPGNLKGRWDSPPPSDSELEVEVSKRNLEDNGASPIRKLPKSDDCTPGFGTA